MQESWRNRVALFPVRHISWRIEARAWGFHKISLDTIWNGYLSILAPDVYRTTQIQSLQAPSLDACALPT